MNPMLFNTIIFLTLTLLAQSALSNKGDIVSSKRGCNLEHNGEELHEGQTIEKNGKFFKVEGCELHRAYHACGTQVLFIINIVCQALDQQRTNPMKQRFSRFVKQKLLTEACCQSVCTVSEMTRYCP